MTSDGIQDTEHAVDTVSRTCLLQGKLTAILLGRRVEGGGRGEMEVGRKEERVRKEGGMKDSTNEWKCMRAGFVVSPSSSPAQRCRL